MVTKAFRTACGQCSWYRVVVVRSFRAALRRGFGPAVELAGAAGCLVAAFLGLAAGLGDASARDAAWAGRSGLGAGGAAWLTLVIGRYAAVSSASTGVARARPPSAVGLMNAVPSACAAPPGTPGIDAPAGVAPPDLPPGASPLGMLPLDIPACGPVAWARAAPAGFAVFGVAPRAG